MKDKIVENVVNKFKQRSALGIKKYNTTLEKNNLTRLEWLTHAQEEAMDMVLYLEKLKSLEPNQENILDQIEELNTPQGRIKL
jgi:hypothetical protein